MPIIRAVIKGIISTKALIAYKARELKKPLLFTYNDVDN
jgi:hypothetical protein